MEKFEFYSYDYKYQGSTWGANIMATSREDAKARLDAIRNNVDIIGPCQIIPSDKPPDPKYGNGLLWDSPPPTKHNSDPIE